ncbi:MAG: DUF5018 domain-containing protein [Rikenellaceae bacterium]|nr:DUF5018 domain-containing protein [Rikenellaceae bacterium]MBR2419349.1 DUF5018 domain-containing protein [Rikenellaceae bacterium]
MKKSIFWTLLAVVLSFAACQEPEVLVPAEANKGINNLTVYPTWDGYHTADATGFTSKIDYEKRVITIQVPYTLPVESDNVQKLEDYKKVWVQFNLDDNATLEPKLTTIDLTQTYKVTLTDQKKEQSEWTIKAALAKSSACDIESFAIPSLGLTAVIDKSSATASLIYFEQLKNVFAEVVVSPHAKIVPDPATTAFWCSPDEPKKFTVIAQDGVTSREWTLQQTEPARVEEGIRPESGKLLWTTKLSAAGVAKLDMTTGIAVTDDYVVLNTRGEDPIVLDAKKGTTVGTISLGSIKGATSSYYMTSDHKGHIVINNRVPDDGGVFRVWRMRDINSTPELFIEYATTDVYGDHISVWGDVYGDATVQAAYCGWTSTGSTSTLTWTVKGGQTVSMQPYWCQISGVGGWTNGDAIRMGTEANSDFLAVGYSMNKLTWVDGATNTALNYVQGTLTGNEGMKAIDAVSFNGLNYVAATMETFFTWGVAGGMWVMEAKYPQTFSGSLELDASLDPDCVVYDLDRGEGGYGIYGGRANDGTNGNAIQDVKLHVTKDGYFMYAYFMFCNGYVGCVQFDCIAQ